MLTPACIKHTSAPRLLKGPCTCALAVHAAASCADLSTTAGPPSTAAMVCNAQLACYSCKAHRNSAALRTYPKRVRRTLQPAPCARRRPLSLHTWCATAALAAPAGPSRAQRQIHWATAGPPRPWPAESRPAPPATRAAWAAPRRAPQQPEDAT